MTLQKLNWLRTSWIILEFPLSQLDLNYVRNKDASFKLESD